MYYKKPNDVRYVDMCIYIDTHIYTDNYDEELVFKYIYYLVKMLTIKSKYFKDWDQLDDFSIFAAINYYMRLTNKESIEKNGKVKSILNYIKGSLYSQKLKYQSMNYYNDKLIEESHKENDWRSNIKIDLDPNYNKYLALGFEDELRANDVSLYLNSFKDVIKDVLKHSPYRGNKELYHKIYISCLLSVLSYITPFTSKIKLFEKRMISTPLREDEHRNYIYDLIRKSPTFVELYQLDKDMLPYVTVQVRKILRKIESDLLELSTLYQFDYQFMIKNYREDFILNQQGDVSY